MCEWLNAAVLASEPNIWIHNHNKIGLSSYEEEYSRELCGRPKQRLQFHQAVLQAMLTTARPYGGYVQNLSFFNQRALDWTEEAHPGRSLQAARQSVFPPNEVELYKWCSLPLPKLGFRDSGLKGYLRQGEGLIFTAWIKHTRASHILQHCPGRVGRRWRFRFLPATWRRRRRRKRVNLCYAASNLMRRLWYTMVHAPTAEECPQHVVLLIHSCFQCHSEMFIRLLMHVLHFSLQPGVRKGHALIWAQIRRRRSCSAKMTSESGHASDSEEIERRMAPGLRDHDPGPAPTTPAGTPLPRGPPPPRAVHEAQQAISHRLSGALGQAMLEQGVYLRQILTLLPAHWQHLDSITVQIGPQTPAQAFHPNNVNFEEDYVDPEPCADEAEAAEGEGSSGPVRVTSAVASAPWRATASSKPKPKANRKREPYLPACILLLIFPLVSESIPGGYLGGPEVLELSSAEHFRKLAEGPKGRGCASGMCPVSAVIEKLYGALMCSGYKRYASVMPTFIAIAYEQGVAASIPCSQWLARYNTGSVYDQASHLLWCALYIYTQGLYTFLHMMYRVLRMTWMILLHMQLLIMVQFPDSLQDDHAMLIQQHVTGTMNLPKSSSTSTSSMAGTSYWPKEHSSMNDPGRNMHLDVYEQQQAHSLDFREGSITCKTGSRQRTLTHGRVGPKSDHIHGCRSRTNLTFYFLYCCGLALFRHNL